MDKQLTEHLTEEDALEMYLDALEEYARHPGLVPLTPTQEINLAVAYAYEQGRRDETAERGQ